jgi:hypothetical protein
MFFNSKIFKNFKLELVNKIKQLPNTRNHNKMLILINDP